MSLTCSWVVLYVLNWARTSGNAARSVWPHLGARDRGAVLLLSPAALFVPRAVASRLSASDRGFDPRRGTGRGGASSSRTVQGVGIDRLANGTDMRADTLLIGCGTSDAVSTSGTFLSSSSFLSACPRRSSRPRREPALIASATSSFLVGRRVLARKPRWQRRATPTGDAPELRPSV